MFIRKYWIPLSVFIVAIVGVGLYLLAIQPSPKDPIVVIKPVEPLEKSTAEKPAEDGHFHPDGTFHAEPHAPIAAAVSNRSTFTPTAVADGVNPTSTSSNPLFADGVPEHLQCPPEFIGVYSNEDKERLRSKVMSIYHEVMEKWNPNRPLPEVWYPMIEAEKWYRDNADPDKAEILAGQGRVDWLVQLWLDFPEMIVLSKEDPVRFSDIVRVDMGDWSPDWNAFTLPDGSGRVFRMDYDKRYEFTWSNYTEKEDGNFTSNTFTHKTGLSGENGELVKINLDEVSDEDLERLGGWNFNINPYTTGAYKLGDKK